MLNRTTFHDFNGGKWNNGISNNRVGWHYLNTIDKVAANNKIDL